MGVSVNRCSYGLSVIFFLKGGLRPCQRLCRGLGPGWIFTGLEY